MTREKKKGKKEELAVINVDLDEYLDETRQAFVLLMGVLYGRVEAETGDKEGEVEDEIREILKNLSDKVRSMDKGYRPIAWLEGVSALFHAVLVRMFNKCVEMGREPDACYRMVIDTIAYVGNKVLVTTVAKTLSSILGIQPGNNNTPQPYHI